MRVCPAGNGKGACACAYGQVTNIRLWPRPERNIGVALGLAERRPDSAGARTMNNQTP